MNTPDPLVAIRLALEAVGKDEISTDLFGDRYSQGAWSCTELTKEQDDYLHACNPSAMTEVLTLIDSLRAERDALKADAANVRGKALEEAAQACEAQALRWPRDARSYAAYECAAAVDAAREGEKR